jgi:hypothetical protein
MTVEAAWSSETLVSTYKTAQRYNLEYQHRHMNECRTLDLCVNEHVF